MMCEAARSLSALALPTCPDGDYDCSSSGDDDTAEHYFQSSAAFQSSSNQRSIQQQQPKVAITLVDCSSGAEDIAETSAETLLDQRPKFHLAIPSILTSSDIDEGDSDDYSQDEVDQRFLHAAETSISTNRRSNTTEKLITRLKRSASFTSPYKVARRLSQDSTTTVERKPTLLTRTLSFIKSKMEFASTSTLYPSKDEIRQWQQSFDSLLHHKYGCLVFRDFLKTEFSVENIDFWLSCEEFKKMKEGKKSTLQKAQMIYRQYIAVDSPNEINIDGDVRTATKAALDDGGKPDTFSLAQAQIEQLMEKDSYSRFVRSDYFQRLLLE